MSFCYLFCFIFINFFSIIFVVDGGESKCFIDSAEFAGVLVLIVDGGKKCDPLRTEQQQKAAQLAIEEVNSGKSSRMQIHLGPMIDTCQNPSNTLQNLLETFVETGQVCSTTPTPFLAITDMKNNKMYHLVNNVLINYGLVQYNTIYNFDKKKTNSIIKFESSDLAKTLISLVKQLRWQNLFLIYTNDSISIQDAHLFETFASQNGICVFSKRNYPKRKINRAILITNNHESIDNLIIEMITKISNVSELLISTNRVGLLPILRHLHQKFCLNKQSSSSLFNDTCSILVIQPISKQLQRLTIDKTLIRRYYNRTINTTMSYHKNNGNKGKLMNDQELYSVTDVSLDAIVQGVQLLSTAVHLVQSYCENRIDCLKTLLTNRTQWMEFLNDIIVFEQDNIKSQQHRLPRKLNSVREKYYNVFLVQGEHNQVYHIGDIYGFGRETTISSDFHLSKYHDDGLWCYHMPFDHLTKPYNNQKETTYMLYGLVAGTGFCMLISVSGCAFILYRNFDGQFFQSQKRRTEECEESISIASNESLTITI